MTQKPVTQPAAPGQSFKDMVVFDADSKEATVKTGVAEAHFKFSLTNVSSEEVIINGVTTSCGCTVAKLPASPWKLSPGEGGEISVTMNLAGKSGSVFKTVTVNSDKGSKVLTVKTAILPVPATPAMGERERNQEIAKADRQAVFKGDCARCHMEPAKGLTGKQLYSAMCGVCHEAAHRATMVPDLHAITQETNAEFWRNWISHGKDVSLMPAFAQTDGGPLTDGQIASLVKYLLEAMPSKVTAPAPAVVH